MRARGVETLAENKSQSWTGVSVCAKKRNLRGGYANVPFTSEELKKKRKKKNRKDRKGKATWVQKGTKRELLGR